MEYIKVKLEDVSDRIKCIRTLLLLECYLRTKLLKPEIYKESLSIVLKESIKTCDYPDVVAKIRKVLLIVSKK